MTPRAKDREDLSKKDSSNPPSGDTCAWLCSKSQVLLLSRRRKIRNCIVTAIVYELKIGSLWPMRFSDLPSS